MWFRTLWRELSAPSTIWHWDSHWNNITTILSTFRTRKYDCFQIKLQIERSRQCSFRIRSRNANNNVIKNYIDRIQRVKVVHGVENHPFGTGSVPWTCFAKHVQHTFRQKSRPWGSAFWFHIAGDRLQGWYFWTGYPVSLLDTGHNRLSSFCCRDLFHTPFPVVIN